MFSALSFLFQCMRLRRAPSASPESIARLQHRRFRHLLRMAVERAPFFASKYRNIDPRHAVLADLPPLTKAELMEHFDDTVTDPAIRRAELEPFVDDRANREAQFLGKYVISHTSGSQGQPLLLVQDRKLIQLLFALQSARGCAFGRPSVWEAIRRWREPARLAAIGTRPGFQPSSAAFAHYPKGARVFTKLIPLAADDPELLARLNEARPHVLIAYASELDILAVQADQLHLTDLRQIVNNSETLTPQARRRVEEAFRVPVLDNYAMGECPFLSQGCPAGPGAHVNADWAIFEVVDERYRPVPPGVVGKKVLVTNLANTIQPIIRYEIGDAVALADTPCPCGSRLPKIAQIDGRSAEEFRVRSRGRSLVVSGHIFKNAADYMRDIREWQAVQEGPDRIQVRLLPLPGVQTRPDEWRRLYLEQLQRCGLPPLVQVEVSIVDELKPDPKTGKLRRIVSRTDDKKSLKTPPVLQPS